MGSFLFVVLENHSLMFFSIIFLLFPEKGFTTCFLQAHTKQTFAPAMQYIIFVIKKVRYLHTVVKC